MFVPPRQFEDFVGVLTAVNVVALAVCPAINSDLRQRYGLCSQELDSRGQKSKNRRSNANVKACKKRAGAVKLRFLEQVVDG